MRIGYMCPFDDLGCGESEARIRWTYLLEKRGHKVIPLNRVCKTFDTDEHADNLNLDLIITSQVVEQTDIVYPDVPSYFFFWCPVSFFPDALRNDYLKYMGKYDFIVGGYESKNPLATLSLSPYFNYDQLLPLMASVPMDFVIPCEKKKELKLFYVGMLRRYEKLLAKLESKNLVDIYGPQHVFGTTPWAGFKSYKGTIPYDGKTIIEKMHDAGIVLALHSKSHNKEDFVSNRIFEAAAAGAIIIADDNKFIRRYFGDSVYYIDIFKNDIEQDLDNIIQEIFDNPDAALEKAKRAQQIFIEKLSLDAQVDKFLDFIEQKTQESQNTQKPYIVDCIIRLEQASDFDSVYDELKKQYYKNLHLIICADNDSVLNAVKKETIDFDCTFVKTDDGYLSTDVINALKGKYFMLFDKNSVIHKNHILKAVQVLSQSPIDFAYSGSYEKICSGDKIQEYKTIKYTPFNMGDLLNDVSSPDTFGLNMQKFMETYPVSCFMFNRNIITSNTELCNMPFYAVHLSLCVKSVLKNINNHAFMWTISGGTKQKPLYKKTLMYDHLGVEKDEILEKIKTLYVQMIKNKLQKSVYQLPIDIQKDLLKRLYKITKIKYIFALRHKKQYKEQLTRIKQALTDLRNIMYIKRIENEGTI